MTDLATILEGRTNIFLDISSRCPSAYNSPQLKVVLNDEPASSPTREADVYPATACLLATSFCLTSSRCPPCLHLLAFLDLPSPLPLHLLHHTGHDHPGGSWRSPTENTASLPILPCTGMLRPAADVTGSRDHKYPYCESICSGSLHLLIQIRQPTIEYPFRRAVRGVANS